MDGWSRLVPEPPFQPFPYREEDQFKPQSGPPIPILRPTIAVRLTFGERRWGVRALIDSGAPFTLFDRATGDALGVDFSSGSARRETFTIAGGDRLAQMETVELVIPSNPFADLRWTATVGFFLLDWGMPFAGLLGQDGFFDNWVVSLDYPRSFVIEARESFIGRLPAALSEEQLNELWEWQELGWRGQPRKR